MGLGEALSRAALLVLCLLLAGSISGISIEDSFKGVLPYFLSSIAVLALMIVFSDVFLAIPTALFPNLF